MSRTKDPGGLKSLANRLHTAAIHLLRTAAAADAASGVSRARLSALSVIAFAGPIRPSDLAEKEGVTRATISNLLAGLESEALVERLPDQTDSRSYRVIMTKKGRQIFEHARAARLAVLLDALKDIDSTDRIMLGRATDLLVDLFATHPTPHPE